MQVKSKNDSFYAGKFIDKHSTLDKAKKASFNNSFYNRKNSKENKALVMQTENEKKKVDSLLFINS